MNSVRILINTPRLSKAGGVASHYRGLAPHWKCHVQYNQVGSRYGLPAALCLFYDYIKFVFVVILGRFDVVILNPSLGRTALPRDAIFLRLGKLMKVRVVVFLHGWNPYEEKLIDAHPVKFRRQFRHADAFIVLARQFERKLCNWGVSAPIYRTTTKVDNFLVKELDIRAKSFNKTVLFLARLEPSKGVLVALRAFLEVKKKHPGARLLVVGEGSEMEAAVKFANSKEMHCVEFLGNLSGEDLIRAFRESSIYLLPTLHEGMPTTVLEAMAFGLPVITRRVGGLNDFFEDGKMGFISDSMEPGWFSGSICKLLEDPDLVRDIGNYNHAYAMKNFLASQVASELENIVRTL